MTREHLGRAEFERVVDEALESLPERFAAMVQNVAVAVEDEPGDDDLGNVEGGSELLGIYRGVALTERSHDPPLMPDEIVIFRGPINRVTRTREEALHQVRETVISRARALFRACRRRDAALNLCKMLR